jgi:DNA-binding GntR family transcriptional regulator
MEERTVMRNGDEGTDSPEKTTLEDLAYGRIRAAILARKLPPGTRLAEPTLAKKINISRTPVRGALRRLASEGLVTISANHGATVTVPSLRDIENAYQVREALECLAASVAAERASKEDTARLREAEREERRCLAQGDLEGYIRINERIHLLVASLSGNRLLEQAVESAMNRTNVYLSLLDPFYELADSGDRQTWEHAIIIDAMEAGDSLWAEAAMRVHIRSSRAVMDLDLAGRKPSPVDDI